MDAHKHRIDFLLSQGASIPVETSLPSSPCHSSASSSPPSSAPSSPKRELAPAPSSPSLIVSTNISTNSKKMERVMRHQEEIKKMQRNIDAQPYKTQEDCLNWWLSSLRAQTYCSILSSPLQENDNKFRCTFSDSCQKKIKGKGNLRRHIEWHLRRIEDECRNSNKFKAIADSDCKAEIKELLKDKLKHKFDKFLSDEIAHDALVPCKTAHALSPVVPAVLPIRHVIREKDNATLAAANTLSHISFIDCKPVASKFANLVETMVV